MKINNNINEMYNSMYHPKKKCILVTFNKKNHNRKKYVKCVYGLTDSGTVVHWAENESKVFGLYERLRVQQIWDVFQQSFYFVPGALNPG